MINERNTAQPTTPTSAGMQYGYPMGHFDLSSMQPMQNPLDQYSYYTPSLYQPFGSFEEHNQWSPTDLSSSVPPQAAQPPGPLSFHPQMYTPSAIDIPRSPFDYPSPTHAYHHYHAGFTPPAFPGSSASGSSVFEMPWNLHNLSIQSHMQAAPVQAPGAPSKKPSAYNDYSLANNPMDDTLVQHMSSMDLGHSINHENRHRSAYDEVSRAAVLSLREQQPYLSNLGPSQVLSAPAPSGPKSYAGVVSSDTNNRNNNRSSSSMTNFPSHTSEQSSGHAYPHQASHFPSDSFHSQSRTSGNTTGLHWTNPAPSSNMRPSSNQPSSNHQNSHPTTVGTNYDRAVNNNQNNGRRANYPSARASNNGPKADFRENSPCNQQYNPKDFNLNPKGARFFVIKSYSEDDVHRSIKYNIWCSTEHGNKRLDAAFREREGKGPVYLFFSVNASGHFCGMAEMMSPLDYAHQTDVWHMSNKWQGKFEVKWIYVKDVPNQQLRNIRLENNENKPVTNSRDTQEIPYEKGKLMLKTMHLYQDKTSIFDDFHFYESKQAEETTKKPTINDWNWQASTPEGREQQ